MQVNLTDAIHFVVDRRPEGQTEFKIIGGWAGELEAQIFIGACRHGYPKDQFRLLKRTSRTGWTELK